MWLIYILVGLVGLIIGGIYTRRRLVGALRYVGLGERGIRIARWASLWLLYGFPVIIIVAIIVTLVFGRASFPRFEGFWPAWLLGVPFLWSVLVVVQSLPWLLASEIAVAVVRRRRSQALAEKVRAYVVLGVMSVFALYTPLRIAAERGDVRVRNHQVGTGTSKTPFRIAFLADIQQDVHTDADKAREVYAIANASTPDLILSGGDWINTGPDHIAETAQTAAMLKSRLGVFSVRGDHEHFAYLDRERSLREVEAALTANGITTVSDDVRWFQHEGKRIAIAFLNHNYVRRAPDESVAAVLARMAGADYRIAVTHQLDRKLAALLRDQVDLVLGAHTHGGQVNPVIGVTHVKLARLETPFVDGRYKLGTTTVIVTAGVGYSIIPLRYAAPGSMELIELRL
ncbi:MAG TPA: metallophosphoesterase [Kofleriaceae bacterium]